MVEVHEILTQDELNTAFQIRNKVFVEEQCVPEELEYDEFEDSSRHYLVYFNGTPAGTARWRLTPKGIKLERFAVIKDYRSKGVGREILLHILNIVKMLEQKPVYLHAQVNVINFYKKAGFVPVGEQFEEAGIQHYKMIYSP